MTLTRVRAAMAAVTTVMGACPASWGLASRACLFPASCACTSSFPLNVPLEDQPDDDVESDDEADGVCAVAVEGANKANPTPAPVASAAARLAAATDFLISTTSCPS